MEEDFDIYEDLDDFEKKSNEINAQTNKNITELLKELKQLEEKVENINKELSNEKNCRKALETNLSSLLKTAKTEITRKDRIISELRQQLDAMCFRRTKFKIPKIDKSNNKKKIENTQQYPKIDEEQEISSNPNKSLPVYFSAQKYISPLSALSDDEDTEEISHSKQPAMTVYGKRLIIKLKNQEEQEKLQVDQSKLINLNSHTNEPVDNKTEAESTNPQNMDNKENQYRLISLDINLPKNSIKRHYDDNLEEALEKRKKLDETCKTSYKNKNIDHTEKMENSRNCTDKLTDTAINNSEYSCSIQNKNDKLKNLDEQTKKVENKKVHSNRNLDNKRNDRYNKNYKDNKLRSRSRSRRSEPEKTYLNDNRSKRYDNRKNHYEKEDTLKREKRSKSRTDLRNQLNKKKNGVLYNNDFNEKNYSEEKIHSEVRRSRRIEEKSHNRHVDYKKNSDIYDRDNHKNKQSYEEKSRTKKRSKSYDRSGEKKKIIEKDLMSINKNEIKHLENPDVNQMKFDEEIEDGEIIDYPVGNLEKNVDNINKENADNFKFDTLNSHPQSFKEERIENIQEFIQNFEASEKIEETKNENLDKCLNISAQNLEENQCNYHDGCNDGNSEQVQKNDVNNANLDKPICNTDIEKVEECDEKHTNIHEEIVVEKNDQLSSNADTQLLMNIVDSKENATNDDEIKIIENNDQHIKESSKEQQVLMKKKLTTREKPKIIKIDDFTNIEDPVYNSLLTLYLTNKPHSNKIKIDTDSPIDNINSTEVQNNDVVNEVNSEIVKNDSKIINTENVEMCKYDKSQNKNSSNNISESSVKTNSSLNKSIILSSSFGSSVLKCDHELEKSSNFISNKVNNDNDLSIITKNNLEQNVNKCNKDENPNSSNESEKTKNSISGKKKRKIDEKKDSNETNIVIISRRRRPVRLSDFSSL